MAKRKRKQIDDDMKQAREKLAELEEESRRAEMTPKQEAALAVSYTHLTLPTKA